MSHRRTIIIGDVHGCIDELNALLESLGPDSSSDRIIFIGDLFNKGPDPKAVFLRYKELGAEAILGNHEHELLIQADHASRRRKYYYAMAKVFGEVFEDLLASIRDWPLFIEEDDFIAVHGGLVPDRHHTETKPELLVNLRTWDGVGEHLKHPDHPPWFDLYDHSKLVVFGHWASLGGIVRDNVIGLDTGCVYGKELTAVILPERALVSVPAAKAYCPISSKASDA